MTPMMLDTQGASDYLGLPKRTLEDMRFRGSGPRFVKIGKRVRYRVTELDAWVLLHEYATTAEHREKNPGAEDGEDDDEA